MVQDREYYRKDYTVSVRVGGAVRYSAPIGHFHHSRWSRVDWVGSDPQVRPSHNAAYLRSTKLVPNYGYTSPVLLRSAAWLLKSIRRLLHKATGRMSWRMLADRHTSD